MSLDYALSEDGLYEITGKTPYELALPCRDVFACGTHTVDVIGPFLEDEARRVHLGFWEVEAESA